MTLCIIINIIYTCINNNLEQVTNPVKLDLFRLLCKKRHTKSVRPTGHYARCYYATITLIIVNMLR